MSEMDVTFGRALRIWWAFTWRAVLFSFVLGAAAGAIIGIVIPIVGPQLGLQDPNGTIQGVAQIVGGLLGIAMSIWAVKLSLSKRDFGGFRVVLVPLGPLCPLPERMAGPPGK